MGSKHGKAVIQAFQYTKEGVHPKEAARLAGCSITTLYKYTPFKEARKTAKDSPDHAKLTFPPKTAEEILRNRMNKRVTLLSALNGLANTEDETQAIKDFVSRLDDKALDDELAKAGITA